MSGFAHAPLAAIAARKLKTLHKPFDVEELCAAADGVLAEH
jgi:hypothetical protein